MPSIAAIHEGSFAVSPGAGRPRHSLTPSPMAATPRTILITLTVTDGLDVSSDAAGLTTNATTVTTMATPSTQPTMNARLEAPARGLSSIKMTAMMGTGEMATPRASGRISPIACPIASPPAALAHGRRADPLVPHRNRARPLAATPS